MIFEKIRFKNFLSFGNNITEINLNTNELTLFVGSNGSGKSSAIIESVFFGFTGKPYRNCGKPNLVNTHNKKNLLVELELTHNSSKYLIRRGIKPNIFEFYKDGNLVNEDSHVKDYQKQLENMLGMSSNVFKQTIMMSSRFYTPFLELSKSEKRDFIENIFSIRIFSEMNNYLKQKQQSTKFNIETLKNNISNNESNIQLLEELYASQMKECSDKKIEIEKEIERIELDTLTLIKNNDSILEKQNILNEELKSIKEKILLKDKATRQIDLLKFKLNDIKSKLVFFETHDICTSCNQNIDSKIKEKEIASNSLIIDELNEKMEKFLKVNQKLEKLSEKCIKVNNLIIQHNNELSSNNIKINFNNREIIKNKDTVNNLSSVNMDTSKLDMEKKKHKENSLEKKRNEQSLKYIKYTLELLSEKGIKKFIIDKYIPILNGLLNQYLKKFDAPYSVIFDSEFEEKIIARGCDDIGYSSLSSGEKQRLDTALLFSFLELSKMKNSVNTNVIFFDEILDASLDSRGLDGILSIFNEMKLRGYSIFVVSHRDNISENFEKVYEVTKKRFSEIKTL